MTPEFKAKWTAALRSGKYTQGRTYLRQTDSEGERFCCLGVLCDLVDPTAWTPQGSEASTFFYVDGRSAGPSRTVMNKAGLSENHKNALIGMNDGFADKQTNPWKPWTFEQIADWIDKVM